MTIDLRSDTVTKPTEGMLNAMMTAEVGDDVFGSDPTVNALQEKVARYFGKEAALFCPSGTMTNQIAIRVSTRPQDEVICDKYSHIYLYEGGGMMYNSMVSPKLLEGDRGRITTEQIESAINPDDIHLPVSRLVSMENTMNKGGGSIYAIDNLRSIASLCKSKGLRLHLDGARYFNAAVEANYDPLEIGQLFDTISICFSKGLGAPIGSILVCSHEDYLQAKRVRKVFGGGMRQAGYLAAACIYALDHHIDRLKEDHQRAKKLAASIRLTSYIEEVYPVDTNIVICKVHEKYSEKELLEKLEGEGILAVGFGKGLVRFVTHLNFDDDQLAKAIESIMRIKL